MRQLQKTVTLEYKWTIQIICYYSFTQKDLSENEIIIVANSKRKMTQFCYLPNC